MAEWPEKSGNINQWISLKYAINKLSLLREFIAFYLNIYKLNKRNEMWENKRKSNSMNIPKVC